jgi:uroporphyrinogen-III synthase
MEDNHIKVKEVVAYETKFDSKQIDDSLKGIMFYSPSTVQSYKQENDNDNMIAFCIGDTTAAEAKKHFKDVRVAKMPTVESVVRLVNEYFE